MTTAKGSRGFEFGGVEAGPRAKRRSWSMAERQQIVEAALARALRLRRGAGARRTQTWFSNGLSVAGRLARSPPRIAAVARGRRGPVVRSRSSYCAGATGAEGCGRRGGRRAGPAV